MPVLGLAVCAFWTSPVAAQAVDSSPMVTDRPDATESALTVAPGVFQLESGYTFSRVEGIDVHDLGELLLRIGITDAVEVRLGVNSYQWVRVAAGSARGLQDSSVGIKWKLADGEGGRGLRSPQVALLAATTLPTGSSVASQERLQPELRLALAWELTDRLALGVNGFYAYSNDPSTDERFHQGGATASLGCALTERWGVFAEYFGAYTVLRDGPREDYVNGGATFAIGGDLQLDARVGYGLNGLDDDFFLGFGSGVRW